MRKNFRKPDKYINSWLMRYSVRFNVWVNIQGTYVYREYNDSSLNGPLMIYTRPDGSKYLNPKSPGTIELDELVANCWKPEPQDGKKHILIHKDSNKGNCAASNLEWEEVARFSPTEHIREAIKGIWVQFDGTVYQDQSAKHKIPPQDYVPDADTNRTVPIPEPFISYKVKNKYGRYEEKRIPMDELMDLAEFVDGDKSKLRHPKVLHKDGNYLNYDNDNLVWVEEDSPEYQNYLQHKKRDLERRTIEMNPNHPNPLMR